MKRASFALACSLAAQILGYAQSAGTVRGSVQDPSAAV